MTMSYTIKLLLVKQELVNRMISTGLPYLDKLTGGLKPGDNVVWQVSDGVPVEYFIKSYFYGAGDYNDHIIYVSFNFPPHTIIRRYDYLFANENAILVDAFTKGKGNNDPVFLDFYDSGEHDPERFLCIENPKNISSFVELLNTIEIRNRERSFYIFDSLTGMNELWKDEHAVLDFFTFTCPKLYELNTLAYWLLGREAHTREFIAGIMQITQIVFSISASDADYYGLVIHKLEERTPLYGSQPNYFKVIDQEIHFEDKKTPELFRIGEKVKLLRKESRITQAELASSLRMTPGAISQIENDIIAPSLQTLVQLSSIFNKPLDYFIGSPDIKGGMKGYVLSKKGIRLSSPQRNVAMSRLMDSDDPSIKPFSVSISGDKPVEGPIMLHKGKEFITVTRGILKVTIDAEVNILEDGDSLLIFDSFISRWQNGSAEECRFVYILF
jgi:DNA-binding XRE family transcriptional regulator